MSPSVVRVMTLNCWHVSEPFAERMAAIRAGIERHRPDVIGFQEIVVRRDGFDQAAEILAGSGYGHVYGAAFRFDGSGEILPHDADGDGFGNAIASRWPISAAEVKALPGIDSGERRSAIGARIESPHGRIPFVATHLNWKLHHGVVRESQVPAVADLAWQLAGDADFPPIVVGDLNAEPDSTEIRFLCGLASLGGRSTYFQDAWRLAGDGTRGGAPGTTATPMLRSPASRRAASTTSWSGRRTPADAESSNRRSSCSISRTMASTRATTSA
jgi:endonuclease/exonuclease/phosphatase family metal-dependent hydrolase